MSAVIWDSRVPYPARYAVVFYSDYSGKWLELDNFDDKTEAIACAKRVAARDSTIVRVIDNERNVT